MDALSFTDHKLEEQPWKSTNFWVSHFNFAPSVTKQLIKPEQIVVHDSTLRDGEQAPGVSFTEDQKIEIARRLDEIGIQYIEAGFPAVSRSDQKSIEKICTLGLKSRVTCLARALKADIDLAADCGVWAAIVEVPVGYPRLKYQFEWDEATVIAKMSAALEHARKREVNVILFLIDTARSRGGFLREIVTRAAQDDIVKKISAVDTLGAATPDAMALIVSTIRSWVDIPIEVHCHNDFGLATINTIAGLMAGAESFSGTINGLGQRAGNAAIEEIVFALKLLYGVPTTLLTKKLRDLSQHLQNLTQIRMPPYKAIVGEKIFEWEAGIPTAALRKLPTSVEPFTPDLVGSKHTIVLGKKSGKANILFKLEEFGLSCPDSRLQALLNEVKNRAVAKNAPLDDQEFLDTYHFVLDIESEA